MSKLSTSRKPAFPATPINARQKPEAQGIGNEPQEEVLVNIEAPKAEERPKAVRITDEEEDDEVKVYVPKKDNSKKKKNRDIFSRSSRKKKTKDIPDNFDVVEVDDEQDGKNLGIWITVIVSLVVLCLGAGALYAFVNGYFDNIISLL